MILSRLVLSLTLFGFVMGAAHGLADDGATTVTQDASAQKPADKAGGKHQSESRRAAEKEITFIGRWRGLTDDGTVLVVPGETDRGAEIVIGPGDLDSLPVGIRVRVVGVATGRAFQRVIDNLAILRPLIQGTQIIGVESPHSSGESRSIAKSMKGEQGRTTRRTSISANKRSATPEKRCNRKYPGDVLLITEDQTNAAALLIDGKWHRFDLTGTRPSRIYWVYVDSRERCWLVGDGGVTVVDGTRVESFTAEDGLPSGRLSHVFEDSTGRIWIASWDDGVAFREANSDHWRKLTPAEGLRHVDSNGCAEDSIGDFDRNTNSASNHRAEERHKL